MAKKKRKKTSKKYISHIGLSLILLATVLIGMAFIPISGKDGKQILYIDNNDNADSVYEKMSVFCKPYVMPLFKTGSALLSYEDNIRTGRYEIDNDGALTLLRKLRNGTQTPVRLTIPCVRTMEQLAGFLSHKLMLDSTDVINSLNNPEHCSQYGYTPETIPALFIPNTYDIYWNTGWEKFMKRMQDENRKFWNEERMSKAESAGLTEDEVVTLASIIDEETSNNGEKPDIAGMYLNRLEKGIPLQADPTIKFAMKKFHLRRIYNKMLDVKSPYNTYRNKGLPPGPIRIASVAGIDAVLNHTDHNYLYMCAKEDFSGTHNFAETYEEHLRNAKKYTEALNKRNIK